MTDPGTLGFIVVSAPDAGFDGGEDFDMTVAAGVFDCPVAVAFFGDGLQHLTELPEVPGQRNPGKLWQSAGLFGVNEWIAPAEQRAAFEQYTAGAVAAQIEWLEPEAWRHRIRQWQQIIVL